MKTLWAGLRGAVNLLSPVPWFLVLWALNLMVIVGGYQFLGWPSDKMDLIALCVNIFFMLVMFGRLFWHKLHQGLRRRVASWALKGLERSDGELAWYARGPSMGQWKNLCSNGFKPLKITWQDLYVQWPADSVIKHMSQKDIDRNEGAVRNVLFDGYAKPVVSWCEVNISNPYYCWVDLRGMYILIPDQQDRMLWQLTWGDKMPIVNDIQQAVENYDEFRGKNLVDGD